MLPPYNLGQIKQMKSNLVEELIILDWIINTFVPLGIVIFLFYAFLNLSGNPWGVTFVSLSVALNANLMFQVGVTYFETWSLFWVFLFFLCAFGRGKLRFFPGFIVLRFGCACGFQS